VYIDAKQAYLIFRSSQNASGNTVLTEKSENCCRFEYNALNSVVNLSRFQIERIRYSFMVKE